MINVTVTIAEQLKSRPLHACSPIRHGKLRINDSELDPS